MLDEIICTSPQYRSVHSSRLRRNRRQKQIGRKAHQGGLANSLDSVSDVTYIIEDGAKPNTMNCATMNSPSWSHEVQNIASSSPPKSEYIRCVQSPRLRPPSNNDCIRQILDDFNISQSPQASNSNNNCSKTPMLRSPISADHSPQFQFANKPIRTYNIKRKVSARVRLACKLEDAFDSDDSSSSDLSVQQNVSQIERVVVDTVDMYTNDNLTENLLNLSMYFSQSISDELAKGSSSVSVSEIETENLPDPFFGFTQLEIQECVRLYENRLEELNLNKSLDMEKKIPTANANLDISLDELLSNVDKVLEEADRHISIRNDIQNQSAIEEVISKPELNNQLEHMIRPSQLMECENWTDNDFQEIDSITTGFTTASKRPILISHESLELAQQRLLEEEESNFGCKLVSKNENRKQVYKDKNNEVICAGFKTASKKKILISRESLENANKLVTCIEGNPMSIEQDNAANSRVGKKELQGTYLALTNNSKFKGVDFKTASMKGISISNESWDKASKLVAQTEKEAMSVEFSKVMETELQEARLRTAICSPVNKSNIKTTSFKSSCKENIVCNAVHKNLSANLVGFKTASRKEIRISKESLKNAEILVAAIQQEPISPAIIAQCTEEQIPISKFSLQKTDSESLDCIVFQTASNKSIANASEASDRANKIKAEVGIENIFVEPTTFTVNNSIDIGENDDVTMDKGIFDNEIINAVSAATEIDIFNESFQKAKRIFEEIDNSDGGLINCKRTKLGNEIVDFTPPRDTKKSFEARSPLNRIENGVMIKRNRLSLSKRKKVIAQSSQPEEVATPIKTINPALNNANMSTPNLKEFFNSVATSTPLGNKSTRPCVSKELTLTQKEVSESTAAFLEDELNSNNGTNVSGLQHISWEDCQGKSICNSSRATKSYISRSFNFSGMNVVLTDPNPSARTRIARLKIYSRPPPLSPILMKNNSCRPCGLGRKRKSFANNL